MAKIKVTWEFELPIPDELSKYTRDLLTQNIFDNLTNYVICKHFEDASDWLSKSKDNKDTTEYKIYQHHNYWAKLLRDSEKNLKTNYDIILPEIPREWYWMKVEDNKCPVCGSELDGCHIGEFCSNDDCHYVDGRAFLTEEQSIKLKDSILG